MGIKNKITQKISGVEKSKKATEDSVVREDLYQKGLFEPDITISQRYLQCAECESLKEEFKLFGVTIKNMTPACGECGCNLNLKIPLNFEECPLGKW